MHRPLSLRPSLETLSLTLRIHWTLLLGGLVLVGGLMAGVLAEAWVTDDALIAFRYVDNLTAGHGLVYNVGERVEGFSSPLFVALLAAGRWLGARLFPLSQWLGGLCAVAELLLLLWLAWRLTGSRLLALAAGALFASDRIVWVWSTGGLETPLAGLLVTALAAASLYALEHPGARWRAGALCGLLLAWTRPEGIVYALPFLGVLALVRPEGRGGWRPLLGALAILLAGMALLVGARYLYYGRPLPNPYYAKLAAVPTLDMGALYATGWLRRMGLLSPVHALPFLALAAFAANGLMGRLRETGSPPPASAQGGVRGETTREPDTPGLGMRLLLVSLFVELGLVLLVALGGDYMTDFRFARPFMGVFYLLVALALAAAWRNRRGPIWVAALALALLASHGWRQARPTPIAPDAPAPAAHKRILTVTAKRAAAFRAAIRRFARPHDALLVDWAGYRGYGHRYRTVDATGLLSRDIEGNFTLRPARNPETGKRERLPGHARWPTVAYMQRERFAFIFPRISREPPFVSPYKTARHRSYPFVHVTVPLAPGRYLRFFSALSPKEIAERSRRMRVPLCLRPAGGRLTCLDRRAWRKMKGGAF